jgi:hypothetical protein
MREEIKETAMSRWIDEVLGRDDQQRVIMTEAQYTRACESIAEALMDTQPCTPQTPVYEGIQKRWMEQERRREQFAEFRRSLRDEERRNHGFPAEVYFQVLDVFTH